MHRLWFPTSNRLDTWRKALTQHSQRVTVGWLNKAIRDKWHSGSNLTCSTVWTWFSSNGKDQVIVVVCHKERQIVLGVDCALPCVLGAQKWYGEGKKCLLTSLCDSLSKQELKNNALLDKWDEALEAELMELKKGELAFLAIRPKLIQAGYTSLDSIPRTQKGNAIRFFSPALKGVDSRTQEIVPKWIQLLHKHPAHLHALDMKDAQKQRDPGIKPLAWRASRHLNLRTNILSNEIKYVIKSPFCAATSKLGLSSSSIK